MTRDEMAAATERQTNVIRALRGLDRDEVAGRLGRCMAARLDALASAVHVVHPLAAYRAVLASQIANRVMADGRR